MPAWVVHSLIDLCSYQKSQASSLRLSLSVPSAARSRDHGAFDRGTDSATS